ILRYKLQSKNLEMIVCSLLSVILFGTVSAGPEQRIVGGEPLEFHIPYQVALLENGSLHCGGVIYSTRIVLTAGHCVIHQDVENLSVRAGSSTWSNGGQLVDVIKVIKHENYGAINRHLINDVAVLLLSSPLQFDNFTHNIELADSTPSAGTLGLASGWGMTYFSPGNALPDQLHAVIISVKDRNKCQKAYNLLAELLAEDEPIILTEDNICASQFGNGVSHGDSGGPLVTLKPPRLVGIVSAGFRDLMPGYYADTAFFKTWIERTVRK
ncbi:hypothetical protein KR084_000636, partial [Drosophila pseudotakahashii]